MERMGRSRTDRALRGPFVLLPVVPLVLAAVGLAGCGEHGPSGTTITSARDAVVVAADGTTSPATPGRRVHDGEAVRTATTGAAILSTGGRVAYLGYDTLFYPRASGAALRRGAVIVDARRGSKASIDVGDVAVGMGSSSVLRVERTAAVRVAVLAGSARVRSSAGGALNIPGYHQAVLVGRVLPDTTTPLVLTDDPAERVVVPDLVADDEALLRTARALDAGSDGAALVLAAAKDGFVSPASFDTNLALNPAVGRAAATKVSELALPVAIARAARGTDRPAVVKATKQAFELRKQQGSWGVVARLVGTTSSGVSVAIDSLLGSTGSLGPTGPVTGPTGGPVITLPGGQAGGQGGTGNGGGGSHPTPSPSSGGPKPSKSPTPTPSPSGAVDQVRDVVGKLVPTPLPSLPVAPLLPLVPGLLSP